jgi:hypothetical protein
MSILKRCLSCTVIAFTLHTFPCFSFTLADQLKKAEKGDYIVTEQDKTISVLLIRSNGKESLLLEEISAPCSNIDKTTSWKEWVQEGAPGHTSWIMYEVDTRNFSLLESYSFTKRGWLFLDDSQHFFSRLLGLSLQKVPESARKKTGPAPHSDDVDRRKIWNPSIKVEGKKIKKECEAYKGRWPSDDTLLSGCDIMLYFSKDPESFGLPYWIEATNGHYTHSVKAIDSGKNLTSPLPHNIPHRPPQIQHIKKIDHAVRFQLKSPAYYKSFDLFAFDITKPYEKIGPFASEMSSSKEKEIIYLDIKNEVLCQQLQTGHRYKWMIVPKGSNILYIESQDFFLWPSISSK